MVAAKVQIQDTPFWELWLGSSLDAIRVEVRRRVNLINPETLEEIPLEVVRELKDYEMFAASVKILTERNHVAAFLLGELPGGA